MDSAQLGQNSKLSKDELSICNYTGLEKFVLTLDKKENINLKNDLDNQIKCTCKCECKLCIQVRTIQQEKKIFMGSNCEIGLTFRDVPLVEHLREYNLENTFHDSLLGSLELVRTLPNCKLNLGIITFNMAGHHCHNLIDLLFPKEMSYVPDVYVIGIQEAFSREPHELKEWKINIQSTIGPSHVLFHYASLGVLHLCVFIRRDLVWYVTTPEDDSQMCKLNTSRNLFITKGAVAISFNVFGTKFLFVNNHLPAHQSKIQERVDEYIRMTHNLNLPENHSSLESRYLSKDVTNRFDCVFWFGDLNFRIDQDQEIVLEKINLLNTKNKLCFDNIFLYDQLNLARQQDLIFNNFNEHKINFQPTYKYLIGTNEYDIKSTRVPSYTDRILFKSKRSGHIECKLYDVIQGIKCSDHKPVFGLFQCVIRPGKDDCPINAGCFKNDVYLEALKRRMIAHSEMPEMPRNKGLIANFKAKRWFNSNI